MLKNVFIYCAFSSLALFASLRAEDLSEPARLRLIQEKHYRIGMKAMNNRDWVLAERQFGMLFKHFPDSPMGQDAAYYLGVSCFQQEEYDRANEAFSKYLEQQQTPYYFEDALRYKFDIACKFKKGAKRRFFGVKSLPKWVSAEELAIKIFDEVVAAVPCHELAAQSLYAKAEILRSLRNYRESIDVFQQLIRRFPNHELVPESYLLISSVYLEQSQFEEQNPDLLALAQINLRRFQLQFPRDELVSKVEQNVQTLKEFYAHALYDAGQFYERTKHPKASMIYYQNAIEQFPDTAVAQKCQLRLNELSKVVVSGG